MEEMNKLGQETYKMLGWHMSANGVMLHDSDSAFSLSLVHQEMQRFFGSEAGSFLMDNAYHNFLTRLVLHLSEEDEVSRMSPLDKVRRYADANM